MNATWNRSALAAGQPSDPPATRQFLVQTVVLSTVLFNFALCFVNTTLFGIGADAVIAAEITLIGTAFGLIWDRGSTPYAILALLAAYFTAVMVIRNDFDAKILRDLLIPVVFFFLGRYLGQLRSADWLVSVLIIVALGASLFEWLAPDTYLRYFDVIHYYVSRGTLGAGDSDIAAGFFVSGTRPEERALLPFLGDHRASGIFLEPPSVGNFGAIVFAWVLLRDRHRLRALIAKSLAILTLVVLADARFGMYFCIFTLALYAAAPAVRPILLFIAPFLVPIALVTYAGIDWQDSWSNTILGRFLLAGNALSTLDPWQVFGLHATDVRTGASFAQGQLVDSGYAYLLANVGIVGLAGIWGWFVFAPASDKDAWRFKSFAAFYFIVLLTISASVFTIKTAALLWFLYGTLNNPNRALADLRGEGTLVQSGADNAPWLAYR